MGPPCYDQYSTHLQSGSARPPEPRPNFFVQSEYPPIHFDPRGYQDPTQWRHQDHYVQILQDQEQAILQILVKPLLFWWGLFWRFSKMLFHDLQEWSQTILQFHTLLKFTADLKKKKPLANSTRVIQTQYPRESKGARSILSTFAASTCWCKKAFGRAVLLLQYRGEELLASWSEALIAHCSSKFSADVLSPFETDNVANFCSCASDIIVMQR